MPANLGPVRGSDVDGRDRRRGPAGTAGPGPARQSASDSGQRGHAGAGPLVLRAVVWHLAALVGLPMVGKFMFNGNFFVVLAPTLILLCDGRGQLRPDRNTLPERTASLGVPTVIAGSDVPRWTVLPPISLEPAVAR